MPAPHASPPTPLPPAEDAQKAIKNTPSVEQVLAGGMRTPDIYSPGTAKVSTSTMGDAVLRALDKLTS
jgi:hypothetical protein